MTEVERGKLLEFRAPASMLWSIDAAWREAEIPKRPWIAPGYALRGALTVAAGAGSAGKSLHAVGMTCSAALGVPYGRFVPVGPVRVLGYNVEDDEFEQRRRYSAFLRSIGRAPADIIDRVCIVGPRHVGTLIEVDEREGVRFTPAMAELERRIEAFRPDFVTLDPLAELHTADENANTAMRLVAAHFRSLAARHHMAVLIAHHVRKGTVTPGDIDAFRGASAVAGAVRMALTVTTMTADEAERFGIPERHRRYFFRVDGAKQNYAPIEDAEWFERMVHTLDNGDVVPAAMPWTPPDTAPSAETIAAIDYDIAIGCEGQPWSPRLGGKGERHLGVLFDRHGVRGTKVREELVADLLRRHVVAEFRAPNGHWREGLRTAQGQPSNVSWREDSDLET